MYHKKLLEHRPIFAGGPAVRRDLFSSVGFDYIRYSMENKKRQFYFFTGNRVRGGDSVDALSAVKYTWMRQFFVDNVAHNEEVGETQRIPSAFVSGMRTLLTSTKVVETSPDSNRLIRFSGVKNKTKKRGPRNANRCSWPPRTRQPPTPTSIPSTMIWHLTTYRTPKHVNKHPFQRPDVNRKLT